MNLTLEGSVSDCGLHSYFLQDGRKIPVGRRLCMKTDFQSGVSPFRCTAMIQTDVSSMVHSTCGHSTGSEDASRGKAWGFSGW